MSWRARMHCDVRLLQRRAPPQPQPAPPQLTPPQLPVPLRLLDWPSESWLSHQLVTSGAQVSTAHKTVYTRHSAAAASPQHAQRGASPLRKQAITWAPYRGRRPHSMRRHLRGRWHVRPRLPTCHKKPPATRLSPAQRRRIDHVRRALGGVVVGQRCRRSRWRRVRWQGCGGSTFARRGPQRTPQRRSATASVSTRSGRGRSADRYGHAYLMGLHHVCMHGVHACSKGRVRMHILRCVCR